MSAQSVVCPACKNRLPSGWTLHDRGHKLEHVCPHGVGHTCAASTSDGIHGCDGCCRRLKIDRAIKDAQDSGAYEASEHLTSEIDLDMEGE